MHIKPHIHNGRFYNDHNDSIVTRLKDMAICIMRIAKNRLKRAGRYKALLGDANVEQLWSIVPTVVPCSDELRITWLGHATFLIQVNGINILTDPVFYEISSLTKRFIKSPLDAEALPHIDAILISHNHPDHTDELSLKKLKQHQPHVFVPLGNKQWFLNCGFNTVTEMTWWDETIFRTDGKQIKFSFLPASHWTGRSLFDINKSLWGSWMIGAADQNIYFAGDTAYAEHFKIIRETFGLIDVALIPVGPNEPRNLMHDAHVCSEEAVEAFVDLGAIHFIPMHWGTFMFGTDSFIGPIHRLEQHWQTRKHDLTEKTLNLMKFGESRLFTSSQQQQTE